MQIAIAPWCKGLPKASVFRVAALHCCVAPPGWAKTTAHNRAQILFYIAENLSARADEFTQRIDAMTGFVSRTLRMAS